uniref:Uncharacterized protein n=1 Tax=Physcomitrium patens TaxID=3218 RepID=A0A2K1IV59_PHYPA|nr:hypothetical protein PHYPA_025099 [Physcomitrium patens]
MGGIPRTMRALIHVHVGSQCLGATRNHGKGRQKLRVQLATFNKDTNLGIPGNECKREDRQREGVICCFRFSVLLILECGF